MARSSWSIYKKVGVFWISDTPFYRPNDDFIIPLISTQSKAQKANGADVFVTPSTKYTKEVLSLVWYGDDGTMKTKIENYIINQDDLKIVDHNSNTYTGRFISLRPSRLAGLDEDEYDLAADFEQITTLTASSSSSSSFSSSSSSSATP